MKSAVTLIPGGDARWIARAAAADGKLTCDPADARSEPKGRGGSPFVLGYHVLSGIQISLRTLAIGEGGVVENSRGKNFQRNWRGSRSSPPPC